MKAETHPSGYAFEKVVLTPAYVAGIIDGEGSIFSRRYGDPYISVSNTNKDLIDALALLGGYFLERKPGRSIGKKQGWDWVISGEKAARILRKCLPFLIIKREAAVRALEVWAGITGTNHTHFNERIKLAWQQRFTGSHWV